MVGKRKREPRADYLLLSDMALLHTWGRELRRAFGVTAYLVGSALERVDHRDVDVRIMLEDEHYDALAKLADLDALNLALSLWGQKATGLPIDCQLQHRTSANEDFPQRRNPIGRERAETVGADAGGEGGHRG